jgi:hypothetical protein
MNLTNATASCDYFLRGTILSFCSGKGECVALRPNDYPSSADDIGKCICEEGWTGEGDMMNGSGLDCNLNISTLKTIYKVGGAVHVVSLILTIYALSRAFAVVDYKLSAFLKKPSNTVVLNAVAYICCQITSMCRRGYSQEYLHTNNDLTICLATMAGGILFWGFLARSFFEQFLTVCIETSKMSGSEGLLMRDRMKKMNHKTMKLKYVAGVAYCCLLLAHFDQDPGNHTLYSTIYYLMHFGMSIFL